MTIECYKDTCLYHGTHFGDEGPFCFENKCIEVLKRCTMSDNTPFFILLNLLEKKGTISEEERVRLTNISSLFELLEISGKVPPVSVENNLIASCLTKCDLSSVPERINLLTKLSSIIETPELKQLVDSILEEMHSLEGLKN